MPKQQTKGNPRVNQPHNFRTTNTDHMINSQTINSATNTDTNLVNDCKDSVDEYTVNSNNHNHIGSNVNQTGQSLNYFPAQNHHSSQHHAVLSNLNPSNDANFESGQEEKHKKWTN